MSDNSDLGRFGPWSVRTFSVDNSDLGQFDPLDNSDLDHWSIRTSTIGQFGPHPLVNSDLNIPFCE